MLDACLRIEIGPEPRVLPSFMNHFRTLHLRTKVLHFWIQTIFQVFHLDYPMRVYESNPISTVLLGTIRIQSKMILQDVSFLSKAKEMVPNFFWQNLIRVHFQFCSIDSDQRLSDGDQF
jgi:hypothetical protein